jgi:amino acid transporter
MSCHHLLTWPERQPIFILLTVGYKLVYQTKAVLLSDMTFKIGDIPEPEPLPQPRNFLERIWFTII